MAVFFELKNSASDDVKNIFPQIEDFADGYNRKNTKSASRINPSELFSEDTIFPSLIMNKKTNLTDLVSYSGGMNGYGLLVSDKLLSILTKFNIFEYRVVKIDLSYRQKFYDYYWIQILPDIDIINYKQSDFFIYSIGEVKSRNISINTHLELVDFRNKTEWPDQIKYNKICLSDNYSEKGYDLFVLPVVNSGFIISDRVKKLFYLENITGVEIIRDNRIYNDCLLSANTAFSFGPFS